MIKIKKIIFLHLSVVILAIGCQNEVVQVDFKPVQDYVIEHLSETIRLTETLKAQKSREDLVDAFVATRGSYKLAEPFAAYLNAENATRVNGPPLPVFREDNSKVLAPISLQAIEEQVYGEEPIDTALLAYRVQILLGYLNNLKATAESTPITAKRFFVSTHLQLMRVFALGITSFDTPTSLRGVEESIISLQALEETYNLSIADTIRLIDEDLHHSFLSNLDRAKSYLQENDDFNSFNRYEFGREYLNSLTTDWVKIRQTSGLFDDPKIYALNLDAPTFFETNSFNVESFRSSNNRQPSDQQLELGELLFFDKNLSTSKTLSCSSCHTPDKYYQDGLVLGTDKEGKELERNTPTLINSVFQKKFFWDGRSDNLQQQINVVFSNEKEFDQAAHSVSSEILQDTSYIELFRKAYPNKEVDKNLLIKALASYTSTLNSFNSRFDKNMRGESNDFTEEEIKGMNLFMGKALCATCHFVPLTNGTVPPTFSDTEKEILGTPETASNEQVDDDLGFYWQFEQDIHKYMFKTPTIRNIQYTAPYMHNGVYSSLEEVMDFYNQGGGAGMGFDLPHQTLPFDSLNLLENEINAIIAFMETLGEENLAY